MTIIEQIKAEIDKRYAEYREKKKTDNFTYYEGMADALDLFEQFIDTLESEKPLGLEEEIERKYTNDTTTLRTRSQYSELARYFYDLGCRRTAEKYDEIEYNRQRAEESEKPTNQNEDLNDEIKRFVAEYGYERGNDILLIAIVARHFAQWQKEQIMKEAVEGRVSYFESRDVAVIYYDDPKGNTMCFFAPSSSLETGDKVRIIIVKED